MGEKRPRTRARLRKVEASIWGWRNPLEPSDRGDWVHLAAKKPHGEDMVAIRREMRSEQADGGVATGRWGLKEADPQGLEADGV